MPETQRDQGQSQEEEIPLCSLAHSDAETKLDPVRIKEGAGDQKHDRERASNRKPREKSSEILRYSKTDFDGRRSHTLVISHVHTLIRTHTDKHAPGVQLP